MLTRCPPWVFTEHRRKATRAGAGASSGEGLRPLRWKTRFPQKIAPQPGSGAAAISPPESRTWMVGVKGFEPSTHCSPSSGEILWNQWLSAVSANRSRLEEQACYLGRLNRVSSLNMPRSDSRHRRTGRRDRPVPDTPKPSRSRDADLSRPFADSSDDIGKIASRQAVLAQKRGPLRSLAGIFGEGVAEPDRQFHR